MSACRCCDELSWRSSGGALLLSGALLGYAFQRSLSKNVECQLLPVLLARYRYGRNFLFSSSLERRGRAAPSPGLMEWSCEARIEVSTELASIRDLARNNGAMR